MERGESDIGFLTVPTEIQLKIIAYMSYDEISKLRLVSKFQARQSQKIQLNDMFSK